MHSPVSNNMPFSALTGVELATIANFGDNLEYCKRMLAITDHVELGGDVLSRFGSEMAASFFAFQVGLEFDRAVSVYTGSDGLHTVVEFAPEQDLGASAFPLSPELSSFTSTSPETEQSAATNPAPSSASGIRKGPPRPMNCWMLYRDTRHKQLKDQFPHLTVQQICK